MDYPQYRRYVKYRFSETFTKEKVPELNCPHCSRGKLYLDPDTLFYEETPESKSLHKDETWEPYWIRYGFSAVFLCDECTGKTYTCGTGVNEIEYQDALNDQYQCCEHPKFFPKFFEPPLLIFPIHPKCPGIVKELLIASFSVAWADISSAGNRLRTAIEKLLVIIDPDLAKHSMLNNKIIEFKKKQPEIGKLLMAIKWLGNDASHDSVLEECDLMFAYEVMKLVLDNLYDDTEQRLQELVDIIIENKGTPLKYL